MALKSNLGISFGPVVRNGYVSLDVSVDSYPTLTIVEYGTTAKKDIGDRTRVAGLEFFLESISIDQPHLTLLDLESAITYNYTHITKLLCEFPVASKKFVDLYSGQAIRKTESNYYFDLRKLIEFAQSESGTRASINVSKPFEIELAKAPEPTEYINIKQYLDSYVEQEAQVFQFEGDTLDTKPIGARGSVRGKTISNLNIVTNGVTTYKNTVLKWNNKAKNDKRPKIKSSLDEYCIYDGDYQPHLPPPEAGDKLPRDLSIMVDNSGVTKQFKLTKYKYNQPEKEISGLFGYAHCALELVADPLQTTSSSTALLDSLDEGVVTSGNAYQEFLSSIKSQQFGFPDDANFANPIVWRLLEIKETTFIYDYVDPIINPQIKKADGTLQSIEIAEEYRDLLGSKIQVLIAQETNGWEIKRFAQEDPNNWAEGSINAWINLQGIIDNKDTILANSDKQSIQLYNYLLYNAKVKLEQYLYRKIPVFERIDYAIEPFSNYYSDGDKVDWTVEYIPKNKTNLSSKDGDEDLIPVLIPDVNWTPNLLITAQSRYKSSVGLSGNPEYDPFTRNYWGTNPVTITTGSEEYEFIRYSILPSKNTTKNLNSLYNAFNPLQQILTALSTGQAAEGTYYKPHDYMTINDYGLSDVQLQQLSLDVSGLFPSDSTGAEDSYLTATTYRNAQDNSYKSKITTSNFNLSQGRPPSATIRKPTYQVVDIEDTTNPYMSTITYLTESNNPNITSYATADFSNIDTLEKAIDAATNKLVVERFKSGDSCSGQLDFELANNPRIVNCGISVSARNNRSWVIKKASFTIQYSDGNAFAQPVTFEAGSRSIPNITSQTVPIFKAKEEDSSSVEVNVKINLVPQYGTPADKIPSGFSRWVDLS